MDSLYLDFESDPGRSRTGDLRFRNQRTAPLRGSATSQIPSSPNEKASPAHKGTATELRDKIARYVVPEPNSGCWLWLGGVTKCGYGIVRAWGKKRSAHRVSYTVHVGPIPEGLELDHLCRVRSCVNPRHLEPVTYLENQRRGTGTFYSQIMRTRCVNGHPLAGANLVPRPDGHRACRICADASKRRHYERNRDAILAKARLRKRSTVAEASL